MQKSHSGRLERPCKPSSIPPRGFESHLLLHMPFSSAERAPADRAGGAGSNPARVNLYINFLRPGAWSPAGCTNREKQASRLGGSKVAVSHDKVKE